MDELDELRATGDWDKFYKSLTEITRRIGNKCKVPISDQDDILHDVLVDVYSRLNVVRHSGYIKRSIQFGMWKYNRSKNETSIIGNSELRWEDRHRVSSLFDGMC